VSAFENCYLICIFLMVVLLVSNNFKFNISPHFFGVYSMTKLKLSMDSL